MTIGQDEEGVLRVSILANSSTNGLHLLEGKFKQDKKYKIRIYGHNDGTTAPTATNLNVRYQDGTTTTLFFVADAIITSKPIKYLQGVWYDNRARVYGFTAVEIGDL